MTTPELIREKVNQAVRLLKEFDVDCWLTFVRETAITRDPALEFLVTANLTWHSAFVITASGSASAIVGRYDRQMVEDTGAYSSVTGYVEGIRGPLLGLLRALNPLRIGVNYSRDSEICDGLTHGMYLTLLDYLTELGMQDRLVPAENVVSALRQRKSATEIGWIREAIRVTEEIYAAVGAFLKAGRTEEEVGGFVRDRMRALDVVPAWDPGTCPAVFAGPDTAEAHYGPTGRIIQPGHVVNMDFGVKVNGYCSDMQRTFYVLKEGESSPPPDVKKGFDTIVKSIEAARLAMKPGVEGKAADDASRSIITSAGYPEFPHALGHQVGRYAHDGTALLGPAWEKYGRKPFQKLEPGMVFTIEPRLPVNDRGIVTVEEMVLVTDSGTDYLSKPQQELICVR
jgi:Xaa-Pro aminopeptidase